MTDERPFSTWTLGDLLEFLTSTKKEIKETNDLLTDLNKRRDLVESAIINNMENMGLTQVKNEYGTISVTESVYAQIDDLDEFYEHIIETGQPWLLQKRPNLTAFRELLAQGDQIPGLKPFTKRTLTVRK